MSAPQSGVYDESMVVVAEGPKSVGWHDHHGMELTHVREFEPRYANGGPLPPFQDRVSLSTLLAPKRDGRDSFVDENVYVKRATTTTTTRHDSDLPPLAASRVTPTKNGDRRGAAATPSWGVA
jgi:hypothetical protein